MRRAWALWARGVARSGTPQRWLLAQLQGCSLENVSWFMLINSVIRIANIEIKSKFLKTFGL